MAYRDNAYSNDEFLKPLSDEETDRYLKLVEFGDENAAKILAEHNLRLVATIARKYENSTYDSSSFELDDLINTGTIGLMKAIGSFDASKNVKLSTYATHCIENEILMVIRKNVKLKQNTSFETVIGEDYEGNTITIEDILPSSEVIEDDFIKKELYKKMRQWLSSLPPLEKEIAFMRFELRLEQERIAKNLHISRPYVSRLETAARNVIAKKLRKEGLFFAKKMTNEMKKVMNMEINDRVLYLANVFIESNITIDTLAIRYNFSKAALFYYFKRKLKELDITLYERVLNILNEQNMQKKLMRKIDR